MKTKEQVKAVVKPEFVMERDQAYIEQYGVKTDRDLYIDAHMKQLNRIEDLYKDRTTFYKTLVKGEGSASPYMDCLIACKIDTSLKL